jgi:acyl dehydratase
LNKDPPIVKFKEFVPGAVFKAGPREVGEAEMVEFARRYDPQSFHVDPVQAAAGYWGGLICSGWMTCGIAMELAVNHLLDGSGSFGSPGVEQLKWEKPVRPGDHLTLVVTVLESRISSSKHVGIVRWKWELYSQLEVRVLSLVATSLFEV